MSHNEESWWSLLGLVLHDIRGQASSWMTQHEICCLYPLRFTVSGGLLEALQTRAWLQYAWIAICLDRL
jgi:hypothetical protein